MKLVLSLAISLLLFVFITNLSVVFSKDDSEIILDINRRFVFQGEKYYLVPTSVGPQVGGLKLGKTSDLKCPVTVLQEYNQVVGLPVQFFAEIGGPEVKTSTPLKIAFTDKPDCAESPLWCVFHDNAIQQDCVGIGGPQNYDADHVDRGTFSFHKFEYGDGYTVKYCPERDGGCYHIGSYDNGEGGRRLCVNIFGEPIPLQFIEAASYEAGIIKSVV